MPAKSYDELEDMLTVQAANIDEFKDELEATAEEITAITEDLANVTYARNFVETADANKKSTTKLKQDLFNGDENKPLGEFPIFAVGAWPFPDAKNNALGRHNATNARWKTAKGYTEQIGIAMAIISPPPPNVIPGDVKPTINVFEAQTGAHFTVVAGNRQAADSFRVMVRRKGSNEWVVADTGVGKSVDVHMTLTTPGEPEQIQVRIQLRKNGADYGQISDTVYVTLNP